MTAWGPYVLAGIGLLGAGGGLAALVTVGATRRKMLADAEQVRVTTTTVLTKSALELLEPLQERAHEAERRVRAAERQADQLRSQLEELSEAFSDLTAMVRRWRTEIMSPVASLDRLRAMVAAEGRGLNGGSHE